MKGAVFATPPCRSGAGGALGVAGSVAGAHRDPRSSDARGRDRSPTGRPGERASAKARAAREGQRIVPLFTELSRKPISGVFPEAPSCYLAQYCVLARITTRLEGSCAAGVTTT